MISSNDAQNVSSIKATCPFRPWLDRPAFVPHGINRKEPYQFRPWLTPPPIVSQVPQAPPVGEIPRDTEKSEPTKDQRINKKRECLKYSKEQTRILEDGFMKFTFISKAERMKSLTQRTGLTEQQILVWFANRRSNPRYKVNLATRNDAYDRQKDDSDPEKKRRRKVYAYTSVATDLPTELERMYKLNEYPNDAEKFQMADRLGISYIEVNQWFQHRRYSGNTDAMNSLPASSQIYANRQPDAQHRNDREKLNSSSTHVKGSVNVKLVQLHMFDQNQNIVSNQNGCANQYKISVNENTNCNINVSEVL